MAFKIWDQVVITQEGIKRRWQGYGQLPKGVVWRITIIDNSIYCPYQVTWDDDYNVYREQDLKLFANQKENMTLIQNFIIETSYPNNIRNTINKEFIIKNYRCSVGWRRYYLFEDGENTYTSDGNNYSDYNYPRIHIDDENLIKILSNNKPKKTMKKEIWWYTCEYFTQGDEFVVTFQDWKYKWNFYGDIEEFLTKNKWVISGFFDNKVDEKTKEIIKKFSLSFVDFKVELRKLYIPQTKDLLIAKTMEMIKDQAIELASLFEDKGIKTGIMSLFSKK